MSNAVLWPRLATGHAMVLRRSVSGMSVHEARLAGRLAHPGAAPAGWGPGASEEQVQRVQQIMRAVSDDRGWPASLDADTASELDRVWGRLLHEQMNILPSDAASAGVWDFVALVVLPDLARWRFPGGSGAGVDGFDKHVFGRLWWRQHVLGTELLDGAGHEPLSEDELDALFRRRDLVANPHVAQAVARAILRRDDPPRQRPAFAKQLVLELLRATPAVCLDALDGPQLDELMHQVVARSTGTRIPSD